MLLPLSRSADAPANAVRVHPVTGAFIDHPSHETAFAAQLFRVALPLHTLLLALCLAIAVYMVLHVAPTVRPLWGMVGLAAILVLVRRHAPPSLRHPHVLYTLLTGYYTM